jgi:hypothetical protein
MVVLIVTNVQKAAQKAAITIAIAIVTTKNIVTNFAIC